VTLSSMYLTSPLKSMYTFSRSRITNRSVLWLDLSERGGLCLPKQPPGCFALFYASAKKNAGGREGKS
jgi:hypothetical protein